MSQPSSSPRFSPIMPTAVRPEIVFAKGEGSWLWDESGKRYLDFIQGWAVNALGHCHPAVVQALQTQAATLLNPSPGFYNPAMLKLAGLLTDHSGFDHVFFASSGAEANEGAIKLARKWGTLHKGGAHRIITFESGFHGRTLATMAASGKPGWEQLFTPHIPGFIKLPFNDLAAVERALDESVVAVMLEPVQGEGGVIQATVAFMQGLRRLTHERHALLISDEVQTGMGRCGDLFAHQGYGVQPDIMTLGKGIGGGVPLAALLATKAVSCFAPGDQGGTYSGNALTCAAGVAVLQTLLAPGFMEGVRAKGALLRQTLEGVSANFGLGAVRGRGLLLALDTGNRDAPAIVAAAREAGLLLNAPRPNALRFMPALTVSAGEIRLLGSMLEAVLAR